MVTTLDVEKYDESTFDIKHIQDLRKQYLSNPYTNLNKEHQKTLRLFMLHIEEAALTGQTSYTIVTRSMGKDVRRIYGAYFKTRGFTVKENFFKTIMTVSW